MKNSGALTGMLFAGLLMFLMPALTLSAQNVLTIDCSKPGAQINPQMYGIFFEEINHGGEGGLYAELVRNRNFEEHVLPRGMELKDGFACAPHSRNYAYQPDKPDEWITMEYHDWKTPWNTDSLKMIGWSVAGNADYDVTDEMPLHPNTPNSMYLKMKETGVVLENEGYWGMAVKQGGSYDLRFYLNAVDYAGSVNVRIVSSDKKTVLAEHRFNIEKAEKWQEYTAVLKSVGNDVKASLQLVFEKPGCVYVDYVSLFPQDTFKGRKNGMRKDIAQILADLKPGFMRWPGGCVVEGATLENRMRWKESIGDPMQRRSEWIRWNYHSSWGMGYHEFLQFCEDLGAKAMYVANVGMSCVGNNGDYTDDLEPFVQDIKDAIEYAIGDVTTTWGAKRAAAGHPEPFPLAYVELGNEQFGSIYAERYEYFYSRLKPLYPDITFICTLGMDNMKDALKEVDMIDPHWYSEPKFFYENTHLFDDVKRGKFDIYVGEFACIAESNITGALSEAAFMIGMERNADIVKMASYAPLLENVNQRDWQTNLIWLNSGQVMGRSSYYVQKMFSTNVPTYNLAYSFSRDTEESVGLPYQTLHCIAGYDTDSKETIIKVVNGSAEEKKITVRLNGSQVSASGKVITLSADKPDAENSLDNPRKVAPIETSYEGFGESFDYVFKPYSLTVLRIPTLNK